MTAEAEDLGAHLREACRALPDPSPSAMFDHVYAEPHGLVAEEQQWWQEYLGDGHG